MSTDTRKRTYSFMIDPDLALALKRVKASDGIPESVQIRRALRTWMEKRGVLAKAIQRQPKASR
jgi:hypothetical protein